MAHPEWENDFSSYFEGTLTETRAQELRQNLVACHECQNDYDLFCQAIQNLSVLKKHQVEGMPLVSRVTETIFRRSGGRFFAKSRLGLAAPFFAIALLVLVALLVFLLRWSTRDGFREWFESPPQLPPQLEDAPFGLLPLPFPDADYDSFSR